MVHDSRANIHLRIFFACICVMCLLSLEDGLTNAHYESEWISSPNLSPFHRIQTNSGQLEEMCPLLMSDGCIISMRSRSSHSKHTTAEDISNANNISSTLKNAIPEVEQSVQLSTSKGVRRGGDAEEVEKQPPVQPTAPSDEQPPIATFDEWTKEKLKQEGHRKQHIQNQQQSGNVRSQGTVNIADSSATAKAVSEGSTSPVPAVPSPVIMPQEAAQRNYASKECGAKVLFSNDEAENRNAVLNEKERDDYMRNPCERAHHKWLVIELCETVMPTAIELANFELFSSGPQKVRILASERYPSSEWITLGDFIAEDSRNIQRFAIVAARQYAKFIRVELLTHYGNEHYCTLSMVRVLGISMVDEYEAEAEAASVSASDQANVESAVHERTANVDAAVDGINQPDVTTTKPSNNASDVKVSLRQADELKSKEVPLVDAVVSAVGNIAIKNIKDAFESAFLGKWKSQKGPDMRKISTVFSACTSCPIADSFAVPVLFCRAFFQHLTSGRMKKNKFAEDNPEKQPIERMDPQKHKLENAVLKGEGDKRKKVSKYSSEKRFLRSVTREMICLLDDILDERAPTGANLNISSPQSVPSPSGSHSSNEKAHTHQQNQQPTSATALPSKGTAHGHQTLPGASLSHKESVFLKLNKRISALELNMSLSSEYLSELSRRYVEQTNESRKHAEKLVKFAEDAAQNAARAAQQKLAKHVENMGRELRDLSRMVRSLSSRSAAVESSLKMRTVQQHDAQHKRSAEEVLSPREGVYVMPHPREHLLYSNDYVWTTEQLVYMVVAAQGCTVILMLLVQCFYDRHRKIVEESTLREIIDERIRHIVQPVVPRTENEETKPATVVKKSRRPKRRRNNAQLKSCCCEQEDNWDSAMESSARSVTPIRSDLSSELEIDGRPGVAPNPVSDCATILSQLEWANLTEMKRGMDYNKLKPQEHERTPNAVDAQTSRLSNMDISSKAQKNALSESGVLHIGGVARPVADVLAKTPVNALLCSTPPSSGRSWHLVKPNRRRNRKRLVYNGQIAL